MLDQIPQFWQGFLASLLATVVAAIAVKLYGAFSAQSKENKLRKQQELQELRAKMKSPDSVLRVEGYFVTLFTLMKYAFVGSIFWVAAWALSFYAYEVGIALAFGSLVVYYLGLRWLSETHKPPGTTSYSNEGSALTIHSARYGARGQYVYVRSVLAAQLSGGRIQVYAGNQLAGDPCPGVVKELVVDYSFGNERHTRNVQEGDILSLP